MFDAGPLFSLVVPLYKTKPQYLREMIDSVTAQTYGNWELCMALAASGEEDAALISILEEYAGRDADVYKRQAHTMAHTAHFPIPSSPAAG